VGLDALKAAGANIVPASPAMIAEAKKRAGPIIEDWIKQASVKAPNAKAILAEFQAELKKVSAELNPAPAAASKKAAPEKKKP
jgi:hypothetical protein